METNSDPGVPPLTERGQDWLNDRKDLFDVGGLKEEFAALPWSVLFPVNKWFRDRPWSLVWVQFLAFAFCFPLLLIHYYHNGNTSLGEAAWTFSIYFSVLWAVFLHRCLRPEGLKLRTILGVWLFTSILGVLAVYFMSFVGGVLPGIRDVFSATNSASVFGKFIGYTLAVGLIEETAKIIPVLWLLSRCKPAKLPTTAAYIGVISGLAFGSSEAILYSFQYAFGHAMHEMSYGDYLVVQVLRLVSLPFLHAIWTGISSYLISLRFQRRDMGRVLIVIALALVASLHGAYDTFSEGWIGFGVAAASFLIFVGYIRTQSFILEAITFAKFPTKKSPELQALPK